MTDGFLRRGDWDTDKHRRMTWEDPGKDGHPQAKERSRRAVSGAGSPSSSSQGALVLSEDAFTTNSHWPQATRGVNTILYVLEMTHRVNETLSVSLLLSLETVRCCLGFTGRTTRNWKLGQLRIN